MVERINKAKIRPEEQIEKTESRQDTLCNRITVERAIRQKQTQEQKQKKKKEWASWVGLCQT